MTLESDGLPYIKSFCTRTPPVPRSFLFEIFLIFLDTNVCLNGSNLKNSLFHISFFNFLNFFKVIWRIHFFMFSFFTFLNFFHSFISHFSFFLHQKPSQHYNRALGRNMSAQVRKNIIQHIPTWSDTCRCHRIVVWWRHELLDRSDWTVYPPTGTSVIYWTPARPENFLFFCGKIRNTLSFVIENSIGKNEKHQIFGNRDKHQI